MLHDLSRYLIDRGHRVSVFASGPEDRTEDRDGVTYHVLKQRFGSSLRQFNSCHYFAFRLQGLLADCDADLVFCMNYFDAYAALRARRRNGARYKVVFHSAGILSRRYFRAVPLDAWFFRTVRREANLTLAVSQFAGDVFRRNFDREAVVLPPPVMTDHFHPHGGGAASEGQGARGILFVGDLDERRKGARALVRAFARVEKQLPGTMLYFAGRASLSTRQALHQESARLAVEGHVRFLGVGRVEELPALYRSASVTVLPAVGEAFGMALVESLAAGTPVVGTRHGGMPDIVDGALVGRLFDAGDVDEETDNITGLTDAIVDVLARGKTAEVREACRARAEEFSWAALGPRYEEVFRRILPAALMDAEALAEPRADGTAAEAPRVSVVIPTHGRRDMLARLLASLEQQSLDPRLFEVHIVHNFIDDGTEEMARDWCARQPFGAFYYRKNYDGPTRSRDFGARAANGSLIAFIDDDCVASPGWLEAGIAGFESGGAGGDSRATPAAIGLVQGRTLPLPGETQRFLVRTIRVEHPSIFFETCNMFYSKRAFEAVGGFSEDFLDQFSGEDADLGWKFLDNGYASVFAHDALVRHQVFRVSYWQWLAEPLLVLKNLPYLAKKYPGFRRRMFKRYFFTKQTCLFNFFLAGLVLVPLSPWTLLLTLPYLIERYRSGGHVGGVATRLARIAFGIPRGFTMWWALAKGSIQARSILL